MTITKKEVSVDYWDKKIKISVPGDAMIVEGREPIPTTDPEQAIRKAFENPVGAKGLEEYVNSKSRVVIAFDNQHRPGLPRRRILPLLLEELRKSGVEEKNVTLLCAGGACAKATREQLLGYLGPDIFYRFWPYRLVNHDASQHLAYMGVTELGNYVEVNELIAESDFSVYLGTVWPLSWGGFTGAGVVIGLGSARSITSNHSWDVIGMPDSFLANPRTMAYRKHKEAIHRKIEEATGRRIFYVDAIISPPPVGEIVHCFAGHSPEINGKTWPLAESIYQVKVPQADVLVIGVPKASVYGDTDNPLISAVAINTLARFAINDHLVKEGGVVIGLTHCNGTIDERLRPSDREVIELFGKCFSAKELFNFEEEYLYRPDYIERYRHSHAYHPVHPFWLFYECQYMMDHASKIVFAGAENPDAARKLGCTPARDFDEAWRMAERIVGSHPKTLVFPNFWSKMRMLFDVS